MRVLLVCHKPPFPVVDGGTFDSAGLARCLRAAGHEVDILAMAGRTSSDAHRRDDALHQTTVPVDSSPRVFSSLLTLARGEADAISRYRSARFAQKVHETLEDQAYEIVQFDGCATGQYEPSVRRLHRGAIVLRAHNDEADLWNQRSRTRPLPARLFLETHARRLYPIERRLWAQVDGIAAITNELTRACLANGAAEVRYIPVPQLVARAPSPQNTSLFHLGPLDWWPNRLGLEWFLSFCWPRIREAHPAIQFRIAGRGSREFAAPWREVGVLGEGEVQDAGEYVTRAGILVAPTLQGSGMPVKVAQAMAQGKAIVATTIGARGLGVESNRDLLIEDSPEGFASLVCRLVEDPGLARRVGQAAWEFAREHFDDTMVARRVSDLYDAVRRSR